MTVRWLREFDHDGEITFRLGRDGDELVAEWPGFAVLRAHRSGAPFALTPMPGADPVFIEKFHAGLVRALVRHARGEFTLHGACVARGGKAIALLGESGDGKSSLASEACTRPNVELVADDTTQLVAPASLLVVPSETVCWLTGEALGPGTSTRKVPRPVRTLASGSSRLVAAIRLVWEDVPGPILRRVTGARAFQHLARALFRFVVDEPDVELRDFQFLAALAEALPVYELARRRDIRDLGTAADLALALTEGT